MGLGQKETPRLSEWVRLWLDSEPEGVSPRTLLQYGYNLKAYVLPALGSRAIDSITAEDVQELAARLEPKWSGS